MSIKDGMVNIPVSKQLLRDKGIDYRVLGAILLDTEGVKLTQDVFDNYMYLQYEEFCDKYNLSKRLTKKRLKELKEIIPETIESLDYQIAVVPSSLLYKLLPSHKNITVKLACLVLHILRDNNSGKYVPKYIANDELLEYLGCTEPVLHLYVSILNETGLFEALPKE